MLSRSEAADLNFLERAAAIFVGEVDGENVSRSVLPLVKRIAGMNPSPWVVSGRKR